MSRGNLGTDNKEGMAKRMSYVDNNLLPGERVVYRASLHWAIWIPAVLATILSAGMLFPVLLYPLVRQRTTEIAVTNKRLIAKVGWFSVSTVELNLAKVETLSIDQGPIGSWLGYGRVIVVGTGGTRQPISTVAAPMDLRRAVLHQEESDAL